MSDETVENRPTLAHRLSQISWEKALIWSLFLSLLYVLREFFFIVFMTFVFCFVIRSIVNSIRKCLPKCSPLMERIITLGVFLGTLATLGAAVFFVAPKVTQEFKSLSARLKETKIADVENAVLRSTAGNYFFNKKFGKPGSDAYQQGLADWKSNGRQGEGLYRSFPSLESGIRAEFESQYARAHLHHLHDNVTSRDEQKSFDAWFLTTKAEGLIATNRTYYTALLAAKHPDATPDNSPAYVQQLRNVALEDVRTKSVQLAQARDEWERVAAAQQWAEFRQSPEYEKDFEKFYEQRRAKNDHAAPFEYKLFAKLKAAFVRGKEDFLSVVAEHKATETNAEPSADHLAHDFEAGTKQDLAHAWWSTSPAAGTIREHVRNDGPEWLAKVGDWARDALSGLAGLPLQLVTALILTVFITLDFHELKEGIAGIRNTRLRVVHDEVVPGVTALGKLLGKSFRGQAIIALFNAALTFVALIVIGVENKFILSTMVFLFSFVPVVGVVISGIPILVTALIQPGGSIFMALQVVVAIVLLHIVEGAVLGPRIVGKLGHMHPVLVMVILTISEHFFGMWGLLLGVPVAIYVIRIVLLGEGIPGITDDAGDRTHHEAGTAVQP